MSTKAFARTGIALALLTVAACSEPLTPKLERIQSQIANAFGCDVTWTGAAGDGQWQTAGNWAPPALPTSTQDVCITNDVPTMVTVRWDAYARNITIGSLGNATKQTLVLEGFFGFQARTNLTVAEGIDNYGDLVMHGTGNNPAAVQLTVGQTIENRAGAAFRSLSKDFDANGGVLTHYVNANVVNDGTLDWRTSVEMRGTYTNRGVANLQQNWRNWEWYYSYNLPNGTWIQEGGSLNVHAFFTLTDGTLRLEHGTITGVDGPVLKRGTLAIANGSAASGNVTLRETVAMNGDVPTGLRVIVDGYREGTTGLVFNTIVTAANAFRNDGTLRLTGSGGGFGSSAMLVVPGLLDNYGRIEVRPGPNDGAGRWLRASIHNRPGAVVDITTPLEMDKSGATYVNEGTIKVGPSRPVNIINGASFAQLAGAFDIGANAPVLVSGGAFRFDGGAVTGQMPRLHETALSIAPTSTATGALLLTGTTSLTGDVKTGQTLWVETIRPASTGNSINATLNVTGNTVNRGTIRLWAQGAGAGPAFIKVADGATLTNAAGARMEVLTDFDQGNFSNGRELRGNFVNEGTLHLSTVLEYHNGTMRTLAPATVTNSANFGGLLSVNVGATLYASGNFAAHIVNAGNLHIGAAGTAAALNVGRWYDGRNTSSVTVEIGGSPSAPGVDFDRMTFNGPMSIGNATLHVRAANGQCIDGGKSFDVFFYQGAGQVFVNFTGLDLGGGRTVVPEQLSDRYRLRVTGPPCPPPDATPPVITPTVSGTLGNNDWYVSDVTVTWTVTDVESPVTSKTGCDATTLTSDNAGITYTCKATSAGGSAEQSVTIKRDATAPVVNALRSPEPNGHGWNNVDVTVKYISSDVMSGFTGGSNVASSTQVFSTEGANQGGSHVFTDNAGNAATATIGGISIDKTAPLIDVTRLPAANANGWNNTNVTATATVADELSGIPGPGSLTATNVFSTEGANQQVGFGWCDRAYNCTNVSVTGVNIDKTAPTVTVTRSPAPDASGWNDTDVTATWTASDALSGIDGSSTASHLFNTEGAAQSATRSFSDKAGNGASATISNVNIDKTPTPPPPPPPSTLTPVCSVTPSEIWAPNNKMVAVRVTVGGTGVTSYSLRSVMNNESGSADVAGWMLGTADVDGNVLAKRNGGGTGRTYTLTYDVFGANGATGSCAVTVRVPHDQRAR